MNIDELNKTERSILVYAESCLVDHGGLLEGQRMNSEDHTALNKLQDSGLLTWGRIYSKLIMATPDHFTTKPTHWVKFTPEAWALAGQIRQRRAERRGPFATAVFEDVEARALEAA